MVADSVEVVVLAVQLPGGLVAAWFSFTDTHLYLQWIVAILANAACYMLLFMLVVSLYSRSRQTSADVFGTTRLNSLGVARFCGFFFAINLLSVVFLCFNTKRIEFFDSPSPHVALVMVTSALSLSLGGVAWLALLQTCGQKRPSMK